MKQFERAEQLLNERLDIVMNMPQSTPADSAFLNGAAQMVKALGLDFVCRDGKFDIFVPEVIDDDAVPMEEQLSNIYKYLVAYELSNKGRLTENAEYEICAARATVKVLQRHSTELDLITVNE